MIVSRLVTTSRAHQTCHFATSEDRGVRLSDVVRMERIDPGFVFPPIAVESTSDGTTLCLTDGGVSGFARRSPLLDGLPSVPRT